MRTATRPLANAQGRTNLSHFLRIQDGFILRRDNHPARIAITLLFVSIIAACQYQSSTSHTNEYRAGIINPSPYYKLIVDGFKKSITEMAANDGKQVIFFQPPYSMTVNIDDAINDIKAKNVDIVLTSTSLATLRAKELLSKHNTPIVFAPIYDPIRLGLVDKLVGHKSNITGVKIGGSNPKALEWLLAVKPNIKNILVPFSGKIIVETYSLADLQKGADKLGIKLSVVNANTRDELKHVLDDIPKNIDAIWLLHSTFLILNSDIYTESAIRHKIPVASGTSQQESGVMISYGQNHEKTGMQAGRLAYQILKGVPPTDLPVETADFFLDINLVTASAAGIEIPYEVLLQANNIIRNGNNKK